MSSRPALVLGGLAVAGLAAAGVMWLVQDPASEVPGTRDAAPAAAIPTAGSDCERIAGAIRAGAGAQLANVPLGEHINERRLTETATDFAVCRALETGAAEPCFAGAPVAEDFCAQRFVLPRLIGAGDECTAVASEMTALFGGEAAPLQALCRGLQGDARACDELAQTNAEQGLGAQCHALRTGKEAACSQCTTGRCKKSCVALVRYRGAVEKGEVVDTGEVPSGPLALALRLAYEPGFSCAAWFDAYFLPLCTADNADDTPDPDAASGG